MFFLQIEIYTEKIEEQPVENTIFNTKNNLMKLLKPINWANIFAEKNKTISRFNTNMRTFNS